MQWTVYGASQRGGEIVDHIHCWAPIADIGYRSIQVAVLH